MTASESSNKWPRADQLVKRGEIVIYAMFVLMLRKTLNYPLLCFRILCHSTARETSKIARGGMLGLSKASILLELAFVDRLPLMILLSKKITTSGI